MLKAVDRIVRFAKRQSKATKFALAVIGILLVSVGYIVRPWYPYRGFAATFTGLTMDLGVMFVLYLEIQDMERGIENTRSEIHNIRRDIEESNDEIQITKNWISSATDEIDEIYRGTFGMNGVNSGSDNIEDRLSRTEDYVDNEVRQMKDEFERFKDSIRTNF